MVVLRQFILLLDSNGYHRWTAHHHADADAMIRLPGLWTDSQWNVKKWCTFSKLNEIVSLFMYLSGTTCQTRACLLWCTLICASWPHRYLSPGLLLNCGCREHTAGSIRGKGAHARLIVEVKLWWSGTWMHFFFVWVPHHSCRYLLEYQYQTNR